MMTDATAIDQIVAANRYMVLGTADRTGRPWVTPVFFSPFGADRICWVSSPDSRHSRNIAQREEIAITVFDSTVAVGRAEAAYFDADATAASSDEVFEALDALNARLPQKGRLTIDDVHRGLGVYVADVRHRYLLVRGGNPEHGNLFDATLEVRAKGNRS
jgi:hypothetical protein